MSLSRAALEKQNCRLITLLRDSNVDIPADLLAVYQPPGLPDLPRELLDEIFMLSFPANRGLPFERLARGKNLFNTTTGLSRPYAIHPKLFEIAVQEVRKYITVVHDLGIVRVNFFHTREDHLMRESWLGSWAQSHNVRRGFCCINTTQLEKIVHLRLTVPLGGLECRFVMADHAKLTSQAVHVLQSTSQLFPALRTLEVNLWVGIGSGTQGFGTQCYTFEMMSMRLSEGSAASPQGRALRASVEAIVTVMQSIRLQEARLSIEGSRTQISTLSFLGEWEQAAKEPAEIVRQMLGRKEAAKGLILI
ncbi:hypothetical protein LTR85_009019 [Meristemomyces frigidus]|nr:hypothetical protein LTR85_009019 [Meristemomyces frigidus]